MVCQLPKVGGKGGGCVHVAASVKLVGFVCSYVHSGVPCAASTDDPYNEEKGPSRTVLCTWVA